MNDAQRARAEDVFLGALAMPAAERAAWVRRACGEEPEVVAEVLSLLEFAEGTESYLAALAAEAGAPYGADRQLQESGLEGERIGHYELVREIGRGGMGAVYLAERVDGEFDQRVAIKLLRRGLDTDDILARFRIERQILASLNHPHIARLFDGGATESGRPYLVMELVEGVPITEYCDRHRLTVRERLRLFVQVARAVQHAHSKLIAHRDIKPSNILVTADGTPKLLDFGIARLLDDAYGAEENARTPTGLRLMTPEYASPEQVRGEPVTAASDVYQLGVLLYQLLAGRRPYRLRGRTAQEIERIVGEQDRPSPSATLVASAKPGDAGETRGPTRDEPEPDEIARLRRTDVRRLRARLRGDLDTILLKAVRTDQERRYASAGELADDIERHLDGLPILARAPSIRYRAGKFVRRHRVAVALVALAVTGAATAGAWESWRTAQVSAERERTLYEAERERARFAAERAGAVPRVQQGSTAEAINDHGVVVGTARNDYGDQHAVHWIVDADGRVTGPQEYDIPPVVEGMEGARSVSMARGINNHGAAVGHVELVGTGIVPGTLHRPLIYHEGEARLLSRPPGAIETWPSEMNRAGWVVGFATFPEAAGIFGRALVWFDPLNPDEQPVQLPPLPGARHSHGRWINDSGVVGGSSGGRQAFWRIGPDGSVSEPEPVGEGRDLAMNNAAATVGDFPDGRAYFRPAGSDMVELQPLHEHGGAVPWGLNSPAAGEPTLVVGSSRGPGSVRAVLWTVHADGSADGPVELSVANGYSDSSARDVNAQGWIIGVSNSGHSDEMATLWRPLQEGEGYAIIPLGSFGPGPSASLVHVCEGSACRFADTSMPGSGPMTAWSWDSGAGQTATAQETSFSFRAPGSYTVTLQITDVSGRRGEAQVEIICTRRLRGGVRCR